MQIFINFFFTFCKSLKMMKISVMLHDTKYFLPMFQNLTSDIKGVQFKLVEHPADPQNQ